MWKMWAIYHRLQEGIICLETSLIDGILAWKRGFSSQTFFKTLAYFSEETSVYILKPCWELGQSFEQSLWGGKLVSLLKNLEIYWMNNIKQLLNDRLSMLWRIMQISEDVVHLGRGECPGMDDVLLDLQNSSHHT